MVKRAGSSSSKLEVGVIGGSIEVAVIHEFIQSIAGVIVSNYWGTSICRETDT